MIRVATREDFKTCIDLLKQFGNTEKLTDDYLYLNNQKHGFTVLVFQGHNAIAISTFSIRTHEVSHKKSKVLYWENLLVDQGSRNGLAYFIILSYIKKILKSGDFDDLYFMAHRKEALKVHQAAKFKIIGYINLAFHNITFNVKRSLQKSVELLTYDEFGALLLSKTQSGKIEVDLFHGFNNIQSSALARQISGKTGTVMIDREKKEITLIRSLYSNNLIAINLIIPSDCNRKISKIQSINCPIIEINLKLVKSKGRRKIFGIDHSRLNYEAMSLKQSVNFNSIQLWEHDAW